MNSSATMSNPSVLLSAPGDLAANESQAHTTDHGGTSNNDRISVISNARSRSASPNVPGLRQSGIKPGGLFKAMTLIEFRGLRFVIMDAPSELNVVHYAKELVKYNVTDVCRACEPTYSADSLAAFNLNVHELNFKDGDPPPPQIISQWLQLVADKFPASLTAWSSGNTGGTSSDVSANTIAVHCVAGLGRAPVLVAVALIEAGMNPLEAVEYIRSKRRGALNMKQIHFLDQYKRRVGKGKSAHTGDSKCWIM